MSEYWVSKKKYYCKYCDIYIADDAPSRQQHENGLRHKGNTERFIRGIYKAGEKKKKDLEEEKRDMARVELAAQAAFAQDVGAGIARPAASSSSAPSASTSKKPPPKPSNPFTNYSTAESLGYTDPDAERLAAEAERRRMQGLAGEWELIPIQTPPLQEDNADGVGEVAGVKREAEAPPVEDDPRRYKLQRKTMGVGLGEIYDPGLIPIKVKKSDPDPKSEEDLMPAGSSTTLAPGELKWTTRQWKPATVNASTDQSTEKPLHQTPPADDSLQPDIKTEASQPDIKPDPSTPSQESTVKSEELSSPPIDSATPGSVPVFRKRKIQAPSSRGRRQV